MRAIARRLGIGCPAVAVAGPPLAPSGEIVIALARVHDRKLAQARGPEDAFNPYLCRVAPANMPFDPALHPRWPAGRGDGGQFRPSDAGAVLPVAAQEGQRATLPPGSYRADLKDLVERIANATPEDAAALHREIEQRYGAAGDQVSAGVLHLAVNEATRPNITAEDRQKILNYIARYASRNPENAGLFSDVLGAILSLRGPNSGARFRTRQLLKEHFVDHGGDFGTRTAGEYEAQARAFMTGPAKPGTLQKIRSRDGALIRYNVNTDEFGILDSRASTIRTYYKPDPKIHGFPTNLDYYNAQ